MNSLAERIMEHAVGQPDAVPIQANGRSYLGSRTAVNRALSRLAGSGRLKRIYRGIYMRPIQTRFGLRVPSLHEARASLTELCQRRTVALRGGWGTQSRFCRTPISCASRSGAVAGTARSLFA